MDGITNYINNSKKHLCIIVKCIEENIIFLENELWNSNDEFSNIVDEVISIYYDNYFLYKDNEYDIISKYIDINKQINKKIKNILLSIINYYENNEQQIIIRKKESSILYLSILIYIALVIYDSKFESICEVKLIEKKINNIIDNFAKIKYKENKDLAKLINDIEKNVKYNNNILNKINKLNNNSSNNKFLRINKDNNYFKVLYEYKIDELDNYEGKDIGIVINNLDIESCFNKISYDIYCYNIFNVLKSGLDIKLLFPINKKIFNEKTIDYYLKNINENVLNEVSFIIDYEDIKNEYEYINFLKENNLNVYIEVLKSFETYNYNMFMDIKNIICNEDFLTINEKYLEIWKDMNLNFVIKNMERKINLDDLLKGK